MAVTTEGNHLFGRRRVEPPVEPSWGNCSTKAVLVLPPLFTGSSWAYDNLNRMTASPGFTYTNDVLGNRTMMTPTSGTAGTYTWDCLNRMIATTASSPENASSTASVSYEYRADGMRVEKIDHTGVYALGGGEVNDAYARYRHDGQMLMQTAIVKSDGSTLRIDNGLGARGMDWTSVTTSSGTTTSFPIYDAHGNEVATLSRGSSNTYSLANQRSYGAWGEIRQGSTTGGPRGRYCGSLGHVQDDESGLVYMRARYYEAASGRFLSEDTAADGQNWFVYCSNVPTCATDVSGRAGGPAGSALLWQLINGAALAVGIWLGVLVAKRWFRKQLAIERLKDPGGDAAILAYDDLIVGLSEGEGTAMALFVLLGEGGAMETPVLGTAVCFGMGFIAGFAMELSNLVLEEMIVEMNAS